MPISHKAELPDTGTYRHIKIYGFFYYDSVVKYQFHVWPREALRVLRTKNKIKTLYVALMANTENLAGC